MPNDKQALNLFKTYMVLGPDYERKGDRKPVFPKSITHLIMQYAQYEDWMGTANDLAALLNRDDLDFITQSESWAQDPSLNDAKKWLANPDNNPITESYDIVEKSIMPLVKFIAKSPLVGEDGMTALMWAAGHGHIKALNALVAVPGIDVNAVDDEESTALMYAAISGQTEALKTLLAVPGIDVNAVDENGSTALILAARIGHTEALQALLAVPGIDVNAVDKDSWTALMNATHNGMTETLMLLLAVPSIDANAADCFGRTALMHAAVGGHTEAVRLIKEHLAQSERNNQNKPTLN